VHDLAGDHYSIENIAKIKENLSFGDDKFYHQSRINMLPIE